MELYRNKDWLYDQYWNLNKSQNDIAKECNVNQTTIYNWLKRFNIKTRSTTEANETRYKTYEQLYTNKEWLEKQYLTLKKTPKQIAIENNLCQRTIQVWLEKLNIPTRNLSNAISLSIKQGRHAVFKKGLVPWNKGKVLSQYRDENHYAWKGEEATYKVIHYYIQRRKEKPEHCENCGKNNCRLELSFDHSLGKPTRNIEDYKYLCSYCHVNRDKKLRKKLGKNRLIIGGY